MLQVNQLIGFGASPEAPPLDGVSGTISGAWSMSRRLLTTYGGALYTTSTGVSALNDQSGNGYNLTQGTGSAQPAVTTAGGKSRACASFDGTDDTLSYATSSNLISVSTGYVIAMAMADAITTDSATIRANDNVWSVINRYAGIALRSTGPTATAWNFAAVENAPSAHSITTGSVRVFEWRHEGGTLYSRVDGGTENSVTSGNTALLTGAFNIAHNDTPIFTDLKLFEIVTFSAIPDSADRDALVANMLRWAQ